MRSNKSVSLFHNLFLFQFHQYGLENKALNEILSNLKFCQFTQDSLYYAMKYASWTFSMNKVYENTANWNVN